MTCPVHLQNQIKEKAEEEGKDALTESEEELLNADQDEVHEVLPDNYGPLSNWDGDYCNFCHGIGQIGTLVFGLLTSALLFYLLDVNQGLAIGAGIVVWGYLAWKVGHRGHFPILGPKLGPIVERFFASFGIYLTATSRLENRETVTDGGTTVENPSEDIPTVDDVELDDEGTEFAYDEDRIDLEAQLKQERRQRELKEKLAERRKEELIEVKQDRNQIEDEVESLEEKNEQLKEQKQTIAKKNEKLQGLLNKRSFEGIPGGKGEYLGFHPLHSKNLEQVDDAGGAFVGPVWIKKFVEVYIERFQQNVELAYIATSEDEVGQLEDIPNNLTEEQVPDYEDNLFPKPSTLENPPTHRHSGKKGYNPENPNHRVLLWNAPGNVHEARKEIVANEDSDYHRVPVVIAWDNEGNYCPPPFDPRGFETVQELRDQRDKLQRMLRQRRQQLDNQKKRNENLDHEVDILEDALEDVKAELQHARNRERESLQATRSQSRTNRIYEETLEQKDKDLERRVREAEQLREDKDYHRKEKYDETESIEAELAEIEEGVKTKKKHVEAVQLLLRSGYTPSQNGDIDYGRLTDDDYEYDHGDVIQMALNDDEMPSEVKGPLLEELGLAGGGT